MYLRNFRDRSEIKNHYLIHGRISLLIWQLYMAALVLPPAIVNYGMIGGGGKGRIITPVLLPSFGLFGPSLLAGGQWISPLRG